MAIKQWSGAIVAILDLIHIDFVLQKEHIAFISTTFLQIGFTTKMIYFSPWQTALNVYGCSLNRVFGTS